MGIDDEDLCRLVTITLRADGHRVRQGKNALDAFRLLFSLLPDIVILDSQLADINGIEIVRALRETPHGQRVTPILLASNPAEATENLQDPGVPIVGKPVNILALADMVREICPKRQGAVDHTPAQPTAYDLLGLAEGTAPELIAKAADSLIRHFGDLERQARSTHARARAAAVISRVRTARTDLLGGAIDP
ncbi:MAG: response regulator [Pseudomonadota bacterium]|nr:response regulator [Pseudomonadota bacterium]